MKKVISLIIACFIFAAPISFAQSGGGHAFGAGIDCTFSDGTVKHLPRELCTIYGGKYK
ncbi:hypothetical protein [Vibrio alfacsensis]|uniref:hypothetical protein n=1 Tax=Vibrio alfacsensis TaxID=1074311 RepID=UPI001BEEAF43|nr:hypothetical protein [Vibrio alfacsensis]BCN23527.1 hypothetical protein VYA_07190 [Vibrio alfacsensis]